MSGLCRLTTLGLWCPAQKKPNKRGIVKQGFVTTHLSSLMQFNFFFWAPRSKTRGNFRKSGAALASKMAFESKQCAAQPRCPPPLLYNKYPFWASKTCLRVPQVVLTLLAGVNRGVCYEKPFYPRCSCFFALSTKRWVRYSAGHDLPLGLLRSLK